MNEAVKIKNYTTEARITSLSSAVGQSVSWLQKPGGGDAMVTAIIGDGGQKRTPLPDTILKDGDLLIFEGEQSALDKIVSEAKLQLSDRIVGKDDVTDVSSVEAIVGEHSRLIGMSAKDVSLFDSTGLNLLAVSRRANVSRNAWEKSRSVTAMSSCCREICKHFPTSCVSGDVCRSSSAT
jgi:Trk K+ transport system NAD-binding subunit